MELFPPLQPGWLNGWLPLLLFIALFALLMALFPRDVVKRLYGRPHWKRMHFIVAAAGKLITLTNIVLLIFTPLKVESAAFLVGSVVYTIGLIGLVVALFNYRDTPPNQPVTKGLYRFSRNPQAVTIAILLLGVSIAAGSWIAVLLMAVAAVSYHFRILAEEQTCLEQYGESYRSYMKQIPRYFIGL